MTPASQCHLNERPSLVSLAGLIACQCICCYVTKAQESTGQEWAMERQISSCLRHEQSSAVEMGHAALVLQACRPCPGKWSTVPNTCPSIEEQYTKLRHCVSGGLRARISSASPSMWRNICIGIQLPCDKIVVALGNLLLPSPLYAQQAAKHVCKQPWTGLLVFVGWGHDEWGRWGGPVGESRIGSGRICRELCATLRIIVARIVS